MKVCDVYSIIPVTIPHTPYLHIEISSFTLMQHFSFLQLVYQYVYAHTEVKTSFKLCTGAVPMEVLQPDEKSLAQYDLRSSSLLLLEETPSDDDDKWIDELVRTFHIMFLFTCFPFPLGSM